MANDKNTLISSNQIIKFSKTKIIKKKMFSALVRNGGENAILFHGDLAEKKRT